MLRVLTWNLWWRFGPWEERQSAILETLRACDADVLCLQEVWGTEAGEDQVEVLADALGYHHARTPSRFWEGFSFGNAVLSRWPILSVVHHTLPPAHRGGHRSALVATVDAPHGPTVVVSTHLDFRFDRSAERMEQVAELARIVAEVRGDDPESAFPVLLAGDLNAVPDSDEIRALTGRTAPLVPGLVFQDCWELVGDGPGYTWSDGNEYLADSTWPNRRLDYVMVSWPRPKGTGKPVAASLVGAAAVGGVTPSDHYGVLVTLRTR